MDSAVGGKLSNQSQQGFKTKRKVIDQEALLKAEDVLEILGISLSTLRRWERVGKIRRVRLSTRCIRYHSHDESIDNGEAYGLDSDPPQTSPSFIPLPCSGTRKGIRN